MDAILGTWKNVKGSEKNMTEFFDNMKVPEAMREAFMAREYEIAYSKGDGNNKFKVNVKVTNDPKLPDKDYDYELGKTFETVDIDGQKLKGTINWDGKKFVENYLDAHGTEIEIHREIVDGVMKLTMNCKGCSASSDWAKC